mmetsp:Transcript_1851/g.5583  ORF Transcript_1851/g.5583 Transcript_1851/m.5583 type:complete len:244 (-) Transcript_1851:527-1258(-)
MDVQRVTACNDSMPRSISKDASEIRCHVVCEQHLLAFDVPVLPEPHQLQPLEHGQGRPINKEQGVGAKAPPRRRALDDCEVKALALDQQPGLQCRAKASEARQGLAQDLQALLRSVVLRRQLPQRLQLHSDQQLLRGRTGRSPRLRGRGRHGLLGGRWPRLRDASLPRGLLGAGGLRLLEPPLPPQLPDVRELRGARRRRVVRLSASPGRLLGARSGASCRQGLRVRAHRALRRSRRLRRKRL